MLLSDHLCQDGETSRMTLPVYTFKKHIYSQLLSVVVEHL